MNAMKYLVQFDGVLYGYDNPVLLRIDIATNPETATAIFKLREGFTLRYDPVDFDDLRKEEKKENSI
jgi:hypothetical protein